jgi:myo-inositol-1(or 4)-monophosphatase
VRDTARDAGAIATEFFRAGQKTTARTWSKAGGSPVTEADVSVDAFLKVHLSRVLPEAGWLSEETLDNPARLERDQVWIVDPIDGTRAYCAGHLDWSIAIGLLIRGLPVLGLVYAPAHGLLYEASRAAAPSATVSRSPPPATRRSAGRGSPDQSPWPTVSTGPPARRGLSRRSLPGAAPRAGGRWRGRYRARLLQRPRLGHRGRRPHPQRGGRTPDRS